jgi:hypothetical protein
VRAARAVVLREPRGRCGRRLLRDGYPHARANVEVLRSGGARATHASAHLGIHRTLVPRYVGTTAYGALASAPSSAPG